MTEIRHLRNAPIAEAVIEMRIRSTEPVGLETLALLASNWKARFPAQQNVDAVAAAFQLQDGKPLTNAQHEHVGFILRSSDQLQAVQFRRDLFAFSRLQPYTSWEEIVPLARELWTSYLEATRPERLIRVGVRYINRLHFTLPVNLSLFFESPPSIPETLHATIRAYLTRLVVHQRESGNSVVITHATEPSADSGHIVVLLDVDAFRELDMVPNDNQVMRLLESLRLLKNQAFFGSIKETTAEMYA